MTPFIYIVLGIVLTLLFLAIIMPNYRRYPRHYVPEWKQMRYRRDHPYLVY